jgi:Putative Ig domain
MINLFTSESDSFEKQTLPDPKPMKNLLLKIHRPGLARSLALLTSLLPVAASAGVLESFETGVPAIPVITTGEPPVVDPSPYISIEQSTAAGVTEGANSMEIVYDPTQKWHWIGLGYGDTAYADWHANDIMLVDLHRPSLPAGWNLNLEMALNGPMGWTQISLQNYVWLNGGASETVTIAFDYRSVRNAAPLPGASLPENADFLQLNIMARGNQDTGGGVGGRIYLDNIRFVPFVTPPPPPAAAAYTFNTDAQGFAKFDAGSTDLVHSPLFGGSLAASSPAASFSWRSSKNGITGDHLLKLQGCASRGGTISYDIIAPLGTLAGMGMTNVFQPHGTWTWNQVDVTIPPADIQALGDGNEIARVTLPASAFGGGFISAPNYNFHIGFNGPASSPTTLHIDNVMFSPNPDTGSKVTFTNNEQNFLAEAGASLATGAGASAGDNPGLVVETGPGWKWGVNALFNGSSSDPEVAAVHAKLAIAAIKGGSLRFKITQINLLDRAASFTGLQVLTGHNGATWQQQTAWIDQAVFTEGGDTETDPVILPNTTAATFSRTISVPLYPQGSTATDGFLLTPGATDYQFLIGTGTGDLDLTSVALYFDDFEVIPNGDPEIIHAPALPTGSSSFVGRVLSNYQTGVFSATGLPPGVTIDPATGLVYGTPTVNGTYNVVFSITRNGVTDATESVVWEITGATDPGPVVPVITSFSITGNTAVISWTGAGSAPVTVLRSTSLDAGSWLPVSEADTDGTHTDNSAPAGKAFYRISVP